jgi:aminomethyltransferase
VTPPEFSDGGRHEKHSPLEKSHLALGAKMVPFGGWLMPLSYPAGTLTEHRACREDAVAFDVSHLGTVRVEGDGAFDLLQRELSNDLRKVSPGRAQYTHLLDESDASVLDDIIVWWRHDGPFDVMPNASNTERVLDAIGGVDTTADRAIIAIQGPHARQRFASVSAEAAAVAHFGVASFDWHGTPCTVAGTGYTGEDGVECSVPVDVATSFWEAVMGAGIRPAGLGARDTLRLEAGLPLHGHELGPGITPLQCGLGWVVGWRKDHLRAREPLEREKARGPARLLRGLVADGRRPPRAGNPVEASGVPVGEVTSGNFSPILARGIAMAFVASAAGVSEGDGATVRIGEAELPVHVTDLPFVREGKPAVDSLDRDA